MSPLYLLLACWHAAKIKESGEHGRDTDWDQNEIKWSTFLLGADQGIKMNSEQLISTDQHIVLDTKETW